MRTKNSNQTHFKISSFYASAFLFAKGLELIDIDKKHNSKRADFIFQDSPQREKWLKEFNFAKKNSPEAMVDAREFVLAIKMLKDKLYQENN